MKLLSENSKDELSESARTNMIVSVTYLRLNAIMFRSTFDEIIILHHNTKIGGGLLHPSVEHSVLFGSGKVGTPFKYRPTLIIKINEIDAPS